MYSLFSSGFQFRAKQFQSFNSDFLPFHKTRAFHYKTISASEGPSSCVLLRPQEGHVCFILCLLCIVFRLSERSWHAAGRRAQRHAAHSALTVCLHLPTQLFFDPVLTEKWVLDQVTQYYYKLLGSKNTSCLVLIFKKPNLPLLVAGGNSFLCDS